MSDVAKVLTESLPYLLKYQGQTVVIKYGGNAMLDEKMKQSVLYDLLFLKMSGLKIVLVHGGGPAITEILDKFEVEHQFVNGLRYTNKKTARLALMALCDLNKSLVCDMIKLGGKAIGMSGVDGTLIEAKQLSEQYGYVGEITRINSELIENVLKMDQMPIIATSGVDQMGNIYNVNADTAASHIAAALKAERLIILSDVRGIYTNFPDESSFVEEIFYHELKALVSSHRISGGMIPKVEAINYALKQGLDQVVLLDGRIKNALLLELFTEKGVGTLIKR